MLLKANLKTDIKAIFNNLKNEENQDIAIEKFATDLSNAIYDFTTSGLVTVNGTSQTGGTVIATGTMT